MIAETWLAAIFAALFGLLIGSFLNVCIYRLPRDLSVVRPRSHCPECQSPVRAWDNLPVLSYFVLRGKCRDCGTRISPRYVLVEALTAVLFAWFVEMEGVTIASLRDCVLSAILLALIFTDLETRLLPEELTISAIPLGLLFAFLTPVGDGSASLFGLSGRLSSVVDSLLGAAVPALALWTTGFVYAKLRGREGLGLGDVVMIAGIGAFLGVRATFLTLVIASLAGSIVGLIYIRATGREASTYQLPLGSFLGAAGIAVAAFGGSFIRWYSGLFS